MTKMTQAEALKRFDELTAARAARLAAEKAAAVDTTTTDNLRKLRDSLAGVHAALTALGIDPTRQGGFMLCDFPSLFGSIDLD